MGDIVIGSGPAGVSAAVALLDRGRTVTLVDVGEQMDAEGEGLRSRLAAVEPVNWSQADVAQLLRPLHAPQTDLLRPFGSDFLFRDSFESFGASGPPAGIELRPSFAAGGLSNGWGASVLPYRSEDLEEWPIHTDELAPHYSAVRDFMPIAARSDDLEPLFPAFHVGEDTSLPLSGQATELLARMDGARTRLSQLGIHYGQSRVAVSSRECRRCRMCLFGCPYQAIFHAGSVLSRLREHERFTYRGGLHVTRFEEVGDSVRVFARSFDGGDGGVLGESVTLSGDRLFIGAGVLPTAQLVLGSLDRYDTAIPLKDSQHFYLPMVQRWRPRPDPAREALHTLTQVFVELIDPEIAAHTVHVQLYSHNDFYASDMRKKLGPLALPARPLIRWLSRRLIVAQGFLHSDASPGMQISVLRTDSGSKLELSVRDNPATAGIVRRARGRIATALRAADLRPLAPLSRLGAVGSSFHCGGSFPMRDAPTGLESDALGRPAGLQRVHIVDASVFPSIPATTITLSVMANAHRIATRAA